MLLNEIVGAQFTPEQIEQLQQMYQGMMDHIDKMGGYDMENDREARLAMSVLARLAKNDFRMPTQQQYDFCVDLLSQ